MNTDTIPPFDYDSSCVYDLIDLIDAGRINAIMVDGIIQDRWVSGDVDQIITAGHQAPDGTPLSDPVVYDTYNFGSLTIAFGGVADWSWNDPQCYFIPASADVQNVLDIGLAAFTPGVDPQDGFTIDSVCVDGDWVDVNSWTDLGVYTRPAPDLVVPSVPASVWVQAPQWRFDPYWLFLVGLAAAWGLIIYAKILRI